MTVLFRHAAAAVAVARACMAVAVATRASAVGAGGAAAMATRVACSHRGEMKNESSYEKAAIKPCVCLLETYHHSMRLVSCWQ